MNNQHTEFAPSERANAQSVQHDADQLQSVVMADDVSCVIPSIVVILNRQRQVVYKNHQLMNFLAETSDQAILGKRPGELFHCIHAIERAEGCGTTEFCRECGAVNAILESQHDKVISVQECRITATDGKAYDLRVWAAPFFFAKVEYTLFGLTDISNEKRRNALEKTFFHDINNILQVILGYSDLAIGTDSSFDMSDYIDRIQTACRTLIEEVASHKKLLQAESGALFTNLSSFSSLALLENISGLFSASTQWGEQTLVIDKNSDDIEITTDKVLLNRIIGNMVKNAIEASALEDKVCLACRYQDESVIFSAHNPGNMPRSVQLQMFQRSFSTKGKGRGIGTYSMKLFGEQYLKGKVWFSTSKEEGTTFFIAIPITLEET